MDQTKRCQSCKQEFDTAIYWARYCSPPCRDGAHYRRRVRKGYYAKALTTPAIRAKLKTHSGVLTPSALGPVLSRGTPADKTAKTETEQTAQTLVR